MVDKKEEWGSVALARREEEGLEVAAVAASADASTKGKEEVKIASTTSREGGGGGGGNMRNRKVRKEMGILLDHISIPHPTPTPNCLLELDTPTPAPTRCMYNGSHALEERTKEKALGDGCDGLALLHNSGDALPFFSFESIRGSFSKSAFCASDVDRGHSETRMEKNKQQQ